MVKPSSSNKSVQRSDSRYKGVRKRKWVSEIRLPNSRERIWLGSYDTPEKAARAFDATLFCLHGYTAKFNFPDNPLDIPGGRSLTLSEIQAATARFANSGLRSSTATTQSDNSSSSSSDLKPSLSPIRFRTGRHKWIVLTPRFSIILRRWVQIMFTVCPIIGFSWVLMIS